MLGLRVRPLHRKWLAFRGIMMLADAISVMMFGFVFLRRPDPLHRKYGILRAAVAFLADPHFLTPEIALDRIALGHFGIAVTLGKTHAAAVAEFANETRHLPLDVGGRPLCRIVEKNLVLDLQTAKLVIEEIQFLINGHR